MPEKRPGWRVLHTLPDPVYGLFSGIFDKTEQFLAHAGDTLYLWGEGEEEPEAVLEGLPEAKSRGVFLAGCLWIATGAGLIRYDGQEANWARDAQPYVPTVVITRLPTGGGVLYENVNLLTPWRKNAFQTDGTSKEFLLDSTVDEDTSVRVWVWGQEMNEGEDFTVNRPEGIITMTQAPAAPGAGSADGLVVEFSSTVEGYTDMADQCTILALCGVGARPTGWSYPATPITPTGTGSAPRGTPLTFPICPTLWWGRRPSRSRATSGWGSTRPW